MSHDFVIKTPEQTWQPDPDLPNYNPQPPQSVLWKEWNDGSDQQAYLYTADAVDPLPEWPALSSVMGAWDQSQPTPDNGYLQLGETYDIDGTTVIGTPTYPIPAEYWTEVNVLGNQAGEATGPLRIVRWQGHPEKKEAVTDTSEYPVVNSPFGLETIRHNIGADAPVWDNVTQYFIGDYVQSPLGTTWQALQDNINDQPFGGNPAWEFINSAGWGWEVIMLSDDPQRDIAARGMGKYSDPACTVFEFTTGSFVDRGDGVFHTLCPPGNRTATPDPLYLALLLGAAQEGYINFLDEDDGATTTELYWAADA